MDENLSGQVTLFDRETKPFRGFVTKPVAKMQLQQFLPDLFRVENSIVNGLFSSDGIYIHVADEKQIRYSFNRCEFLGVQYPLIELLIHHQHMMQMHNEEGIYPMDDFMMPMLRGVGENAPIKDTAYKYGGWSVRLQMSSPIVCQSEPQMLQIAWSGKVKDGPSDTLEMGYMDMHGNGQRMTVHPSEEKVEFPHVHKTFAFSDTVDFAALQEGEPFVFDRIAMSESFVGIAFHGNEQNRIASQSVILPSAMHALYGSGI